MFATSHVGFNNHPDAAAYQDLGDKLQESPHEVTHQYQRRAIRNPDILPERFRQTIPQIFSDNFAHYVEGKAHGVTAYLAQPVERHAFSNEHAFLASFLEFVAKKELLKNPFDEAAAQAEFQSGKIVMPLECYDPYRNFYNALLRENDLDNPDRAEFAWNAVLAGYAAAVKYGEYLAPHNPVPALRKLCSLAENRMDTVVIVPTKIQVRARQHLETFAESDRATVRVSVKQSLFRLESRGPYQPLASDQRPDTAPRPP